MLSRYTRRTMLAGLVAGIGFLQAAEDKPKQLTADEVEQALRDGKAFLLDVREPKELDEFGTIKGYVNIPLGQLESRLNEIPKDKIVVTLCQRGVRAGKAGELLMKNGYTVAGACGILDWKSKQKPVIYPNKK